MDLIQGDEEVVLGGMLDPLNTINRDEEAGGI